MYLIGIKPTAMRNKQLLLFLFIAVVSFTGCQKNMVEEIYTPTVNPVNPDFGTKINTSISGFITDQNGNAAEGAIVTAGTSSTTTDQYGYFSLNNIPFAKSAAVIKINKTGYFSAFRSFFPVAGKPAFIRLQLVQKAIAGSIDAATGGTVNIAGDASINLPANAVVLAANNTAYSGTVQVAAHWLDPSQTAKTQLTMPGNLTGVDSAGHLTALQTFGMLAVELTGSSGELLQIAPGKKARLQFPIPAAFQSAAPATIPLWHFDETLGIWKQEGQATKNGSFYSGDVSHFSWWNCDAPYSLVTLDMQLVNSNLQPLSHVPVIISISNQPGSERINYTNDSGYVHGMVPANQNLQIQAVLPCGDPANIRNISTSNNDIDLGAIQVNSLQGLATISGTVNNCSGNPVTNGRVLVTGTGSNNIINISNGTFSASGVICPGTNASIIAWDDNAVQQSSIQNITLATGTNDLGIISACNTPTTESITVQANVDSAFTLPQYLFGGNFYFLNDSTVINAIDLLNGNQLGFQLSFTGPAVSGTYPLSGNSFYYNGHTWVCTAAASVTITSYGLVGQFISGNLTAQAAPTGFPSLVQTFTIHFDIQRDQ